MVRSMMAALARQQLPAEGRVPGGRPPEPPRAASAAAVSAGRPPAEACAARRSLGARGD